MVLPAVVGTSVSLSDPDPSMESVVVRAWADVASMFVLEPEDAPVTPDVKCPRLVLKSSKMTAACAPEAQPPKITTEPISFFRSHMASLLAQELTHQQAII